MDKIPHVYVCAILSNFLMFHGKVLTRTLNENVDVWVRKKIFLRERKWAVESECFQTCLSSKKCFYHVKTCSFTRRSMHFFLSIYLSRRKIQNHWSISICSFFVHLCNKVRAEKSMCFFIFLPVYKLQTKKFFIFSHYITIIIDYCLQSFCISSNVMRV